MIAPVLTGTASDGHVDLVWDAVPNRKWYRVRKDGKQVASKYMQTSYAALNQPNGVESLWQIVAVLTAGGVVKSNLLPLTPQAPVQTGLVGYAKLAEVTGGGKTITVTVDTGS